jgi:mono/diheme cytochrome c family protein
MGEYFEHVNAAQVAIIRGDLDGVREPAVWIAEHESIAGLALPIEQWSSDTPEGWEAHDPEIRAAARRMAEAQTFEEAAAASSMMVKECGSCHQKVGAEPRVRELGAIGVPPSESLAAVAHMLRHQWAVHQMWIGMINPSDEAWREGAEVLADAPLEPQHLTEGAESTERVRELAERIHELGAQALEPRVWTLRAEIYGELLASCGDCHKLLGKGPR